MVPQTLIDSTGNLSLDKYVVSCNFNTRTPRSFQKSLVEADISLKWGIQEQSNMPSVSG